MSYEYMLHTGTPRLETAFSAIMRGFNREGWELVSVTPVPASRMPEDCYVDLYLRRAIAAVET